MATEKMSGDNNATIRFAVENYFDGNISQAAERTGYTQSQIKKWINDEIRPHVDTTRYFMSIALIPEFTIVCEHHPFDGTESISSQLKNNVERTSQLSRYLCFL
ncbi:helix-turn-helix transcriptional regulator [Cronobacter dublinensis]|nr:helix-turn-helix transcriptional regulator [Cronobacter dublinensis]